MMAADYQPVQESDLESGPTPSAGVVGNAAPVGNYEPVNDNDLAPSGPVPGQTSEFSYKGIPAAAAKRFSQSNPLANIFGAAASRYANNFTTTFNDLNAADGQILKDAGYGDYSGPGALLQHAADAFNSGATLLKNGILAGISSIPAAGAGAGEQFARETGNPNPEAAGRDIGGAFEAALSDVGSQHGMAMEGAAKAASPEAVAKAAADEARQIAASQAQAAAPGIWSHAYRVDGTPDGDLVQKPLGRLPDGAVAAEQAKVVADALHLPPSTADLIHQTYLDTGRPPAEVLMDAQTNHGGVLDDLVAGKVPTAYQLPGRPMTPEELRAARPPADDTGPGGGAGVIGPEPSAPVGFTTAKGSTYEVQPDGTTVRNKSFHPEHGEADQGLQPKSDATFYVTPEQADALGEFQTKGGPAKVIARRPDGSWGVQYTEGKDAGKFERRTIVQPQTTAAKGLLPVETFDGGQRVHFGNEITEVRHAPAPTPEQGVSKIGQSIEAKAVEEKLTSGFANTAGYDKITIKDQAERTANLVNSDLERARAVIRGDRPLPAGMKGTALITAMEDYIKKNPDPDLAYELANSPLVTATSEAAQELRLAAERTPDSATAKLQELRQAQEKQAGGPKEIAARKKAVKEALPEANKVLLPKEELSWDRFLEAIKC